MSEDPVKSLAMVVRLAEERQAFGNLLKRVRDISENDRDTLLRLMAERDYVVGMIDRHFEGRENPFKRPFEYDYKTTLKGALEHLMAAKK
jgi:hypothetical protein